MRHKTFRISFTVKGEAALGTMIAAVAGEVGDLNIQEVIGADPNLTVEPKHRNKSPITPEKRQEYAMRHWTKVKEAMGAKNLHWKQIGLTVERVGGDHPLKWSSLGPLLSEYSKLGLVQRTGRGIYKVVQ